MPTLGEFFSLAWPGKCHSFRPCQLSFSSPSHAHDPFLHVAHPTPPTGHPHVCEGFASPSADPHEHVSTLSHIVCSTLFSHVLLHPLGSFLLVVSLADLLLFPGPLALCPQASLTHSPFLMLESTLPEAAFWHVAASSASSMWPEKLFMPFGNLIVEAGSDQLPGKELPRTSFQKGKRENISLTYINGFLTFNWPCPSPVIWLKAEELLLVTEAHSVWPTQAQGLGCGRCLVSLDWIKLNFLGLEACFLCSCWCFHRHCQILAHA